MNFRIDTNSWFIFCILFLSALALFISVYVAIPYITRRRYLKRKRDKYMLQDKISRQLEEKYDRHKIESLEKSNQRLRTDLSDYLNEILKSKQKRINLTAFFSDFEKLYPDFGHSLQQIIPKISPNEFKLSALLRLNLSSKEIAQLLNISPESVNKARYRLRKKIGLDSKDDLFIFLLNM